MTAFLKVIEALGYCLLVASSVWWVILKADGR